MSNPIAQMIRTGSPTALVLAALLATAGPLAAPASAQPEVHTHYQQLLERGTFALQGGENDEAARLLRLACFGMLEQTTELADCLTRLAVAQAAAGRDQEFGDTFRRLVEIEGRFGGYTEAVAGPIPAGLRASFESEAAERIPARLLAATPAFAGLAAQEPPAGEALGAESRASAEGNPVRPLLPEGGSAAPDATEAPAPVEPAPAPDRAPAEPPAPDDLNAAERVQLARARQLLSDARDQSELEEPARLARAVADANPGSREAQHLAAVIAYRATRWEEAVRYFRRGGDSEETSAESLFYYAVSLYETGEREEAAEILRRSLPRLQPTPFVRSYETKILGDDAAADAGLSGRR